MLERPDGPDLLATAREVLLNELLPALPPEKVFAARMVANAMAIAARAAQADVDAVAPRDLAQLSREIRAGRHDPGTPSHDGVRAWLRDYARLRAGVSAPKALG
jgi:hypothetical protein